MRTPGTPSRSSIAAGDDPAVVDDRDVVADALDLGQEVRVQEDRRAAVASAPG